MESCKLESRPGDPALFPNEADMTQVHDKATGMDHGALSLLDSERTLREQEALLRGQRRRSRRL